MTTTDTQNAIYSIFGDDPDMGELVEMFVEEMPDRIENLLNAAEETDWEKLGSLAHQMKGAGGSYGFDQLTSSAAKLESACRDQMQGEVIKTTLEDLVSLCRRVSVGSDA